MVMGANPEVSGTSLNRMKTDKARAEVKGKFFMLFLQSHKDSSPYKPLIDLLRSRLGSGNNQKKRYIKFLTDLLELVYYALKYRLSLRPSGGLESQAVRKGKGKAKKPVRGSKGAREPRKGKSFGLGA
jgi:hypothetical protein